MDSNFNLYVFFFFFQLGVDIGSSTVARGVVSLVLGYLTNLVIEMAFLVQVSNDPFASHHRELASGLATDLPP